MKQRRSGFVDDPCLGYATATAFGTTQTAPLTSRAKLLILTARLL